MMRNDKSKAQHVRKLVSNWRNNFRENILNYHFMHSFVLGSQFDNDETRELRTYRKQPMQFNKLATLINTLLGEQQQNTPQLEVVPVEDVDAQTVEIRQTLVKEISLSTKAKTVYQTAASQSFTGGYSAIGVDTRYSHNKSFDLDVYLFSFKDPTLTYFDPSADLIDKTDGMYCGYIQRLSRQKFAAAYGKKAERKVLTNSDAYSTDRLNVSESDYNDFKVIWADENTITVTHHFERKYKGDKLYKLSNGKIVDQEEMDQIVEASVDVAIDNYIDGLSQDAEADEEMPDFEEKREYLKENFELIALYDDNELVRIEDERDSKKSVITHFVIAGDQVVDESEFPAEDLPLIFVDQNSFYDKEGQQKCRPFLIDCVDTQKYINYLGTQAAFMLKISRYDQFMGPKSLVRSKDTSRVWKDPQNIQGFLPYDETPNGAKPERIAPPELSQSLVQQYSRAIEDLYTCTGMHPTRLGQGGNEISAAAIDARTRQGSYPTYTAFNSLNRAISSCGTIINQMIPRVYDSERVISIMSNDTGRQNVIINKGSDIYGAKVENDLTKGTFEVNLMAGPSYEGQKAEALDSLNVILKANPNLLNIFADLYAENLPLQNTIEIKNRLKTLVDPQIVEAGKTGQMPQQKQNANPQDMAVAAEIKRKQEELELKKQEIALKMQEAQSKNEIAMLEFEIQKLETAGKLEAEKLRYLAETDRTASDNAIAHADNLTKLLTSSQKC